MKSIESSGKTVEDAVRAGLQQLGCDAADVTIDVLEAGRPGLFGMFGKLAKVRLTLKENDLDFEMPSLSLDSQKTRAPKPEKKAEPKKAEKTEAPAPKNAEAPAAAPRKAEKTEAPEAAKAEEAPAAEAHAAEEPAAEEPAAEAPVAEAPRAPRRSRSNRAEKAERAESRPEKKNDEPFVPSDPETLSEAGRIAYDFLKNVTEKMGVQVAIRVTEEADHLSVAMMGDTLGILIGRRGDTLDALQYLVSLQVNKNREGYMRVSLDTENYRAKREEALTRLAQRMAARARKTGRKVTLEPMNPYERRVLHSALQNNPYVTTHSEGEEPYRRVVITLKSNPDEA
ncbi:MAG: RNA-binding cell elongation regulator Jag/EloR [Eubacteriales bacterium]|nr:RNA-binding cell elongation regulator Jag/EloR [Eubacteriales bacterium]